MKQDCWWVWRPSLHHEEGPQGPPGLWEWRGKEQRQPGGRRIGTQGRGWGAEGGGKDPPCSPRGQCGRGKEASQQKRVPALSLLLHHSLLCRNPCPSSPRQKLNAVGARKAPSVSVCAGTLPTVSSSALALGTLISSISQMQKLSIRTFGRLGRGKRASIRTCLVHSSLLHHFL